MASVAPCHPGAGAAGEAAVAERWKSSGTFRIPSASKNVNEHPTPDARRDQVR